MKSPKIRFKEFQNEWDLTTLGELNIEMLKGSGISKNDLKSNGQIPCIHYGELFTFYKELITQIKHKTDFGSVFSKINDVLMPTSDVTPNGLAKASCIKFDNIALSGDILILRCCNKIDGLFLAYIIRFNQKQILQLVSGTTVYHIYAKDMINFKFYLPTNLKEQEAIGEFFRKIDEILDLEKLRFKKFENFKKTMLDKLFVSSGENKPRLRLGSFTSNWTSVTLGEVCEYRRGSFPQPYGLKQWYDKNGNPFVQVFDVGENFKLKDKTKSNISKLAESMSVFIPKGSLIVTLQGSIGRVAITHYDAFLDRTLLYFQKFNIKIDLYFFQYVLFLLFQQEKQKAPGGTIKTITKEALSSFEFRIPSDIKEQEAIGKFFKKIDEILELSQKRISKLENIKKFLLNKMFV